MNMFWPVKARTKMVRLGTQKKVKESLLWDEAAKQVR